MKTPVILEKWQILTIVCLGIFMSTLDSSILNIANPSIAKSLGINLSSIQWIVSSYTLVITATLLFWGKLGDSCGNAKVFSLGFLVFSLGSFFCSISASLAPLIAARMFQALGASMLMATGIGIIFNAFPTNERGKALGLMGSAVGLGHMTGPSLGGLILHYFSWPTIFLINVPIGLLAFFIARKKLIDDERSIKNFKINYILLLLMIAAVFFLIYSFSKNDFQIHFLLLALTIFVLFFHWDKKSSQALLDYDLFKNKIFVLGNSLAFLAYFTICFPTFLLPFYLEKALAFSPLHSGLFFSILPLILVISAPLAGSLSDRIGSKKIVILAFFILSLAYFIIFSMQWSWTEVLGINFKLENMIYVHWLNPSYLKIFLALICIGVGIGIFSSPNNNSILAASPLEKKGYIGGFIATIRNLALALGVSSAAACFSFFYANLNTSFAEPNQVYAHAISQTFLIPLLICLLAFFLALNSKAR